MAASLTQLRKGALELAVLAMLHARPTYGGELVTALAAYPGLEAPAGTVYPLLTRLRSEGLIDSRWEESTSGPPRRYYALTPAGTRALREQTDTWAGLVEAMNTLLADQRKERR